MYISYTVDIWTFYDLFWYLCSLEILNIFQPLHHMYIYSSVITAIWLIFKINMFKLNMFLLRLLPNKWVIDLPMTTGQTVKVGKYSCIPTFV